MSIISRIRGWFRKMFPIKTIEQALGITLAISAEERREQENLHNIMNGEADWNDEKTPSLRLASSSCKEVARAATTAFESSIGGSPLADYVNEQYQRTVKQIYDIAFNVCANGRIILKPFLYNGDIRVRIVENYAYFPFQYDSADNLIGVVFADTIHANDTYYTLLEECFFDGSTYTVEYTAWRSGSDDALGKQIGLTAVPEWANLPPVIVWPNAVRPWFVEVSLRDGRPIFADGIELIKDADETYSDIRHELYNGRLKIFADTNLFQRDEYGNPIGIDTDFIQVLRRSSTSDDKPMLDTFSPALRIQSLNDGLNITLRQYETVIGLTKATFSDPQTQAKTAEEVRASKPRFADTVGSLQEKVLETAMIELIKVIADIAPRYALAPMGYIEPDDIYFYWDKTYLITKEEEREAHTKELAVLQQLVPLGLNPAYVVAFWNNVSDNFSKITVDDLDEAREKMGSVFEPMEE